MSEKIGIHVLCSNQKDNRPDLAGRSRCERAIDLLNEMMERGQKLRDIHFILTAGLPDKKGHSLSLIYANELEYIWAPLETCMPNISILQGEQPTARDSAEELKAAFQVARDLKFSRLYIISDHWHLLRLRLMISLWKKRGLLPRCQINYSTSRSIEPFWRRIPYEIAAMLYTLWDSEWRKCPAERMRKQREDNFSNLS